MSDISIPFDFLGRLASSTISPSITLEQEVTHHGRERTQTSRNSRFELLEDRRLLTAWNITDKFTVNGFSNAASGNPHPTTDGGEAAFGDSATQTAAQLGQATNNNYGDALSATLSLDAECHRRLHEFQPLELWRHVERRNRFQRQHALHVQRLC